MEDSTNSMIMDNNINFETMGNPQVSPMISFETVQEQPAKIKVIGVGGGGGNAVNHMFREGIHGVDFIVCNTDAKALNASPVPYKIELGKLGAGNIPERARKLALEHKDEIREAISDDTQMLFITAGMGGGTGTGAAPVIAEIAKSIELNDEEVPHILVVAIVTMPFSFEGKKRKEQALAGIEELRKHVDAILIINNDKLRHLGNMPLTQAFSQADDVLLTAAKGIAEIITVSAYVNTDFRDVNTVMEKSGTALMGSGIGRGENRAKKAIEAATTSVLLDDNDIRGAKNILLNFSFSPKNQITMDELGEITDYLTELTGSNDTNVIWGAGDDESLNDELKITFIATGFEQKPGPQTWVLEEKKETVVTEPVAETENDAEKTIIEEPIDTTEPRIIHINTAEETTSENRPSSPFDMGNRDRQVKTVWDLGDLVEEETEELETAVDTVEEAPVESRNYLNDIKIKPTNVATVEVPQQNIERQEPLFKVERTDAYTEPKATVEPAIASEARISQKIEQAFTPNQLIEESKVMSRAERIRRMNELLHNNPDGPRMVESLTTEQLTGEPIIETMHSTVKDATRMTIDANGKMTRGISYLEDLPD